MKKFDSVLKTTYFSGCNPMYFKPCKEGQQIFLSGNNVAESPAMLAFLTAKENGINEKDIEIVSIGSISQRADKVSANIGIVEWISRISSLQGASKRFSQDYLVYYMHQIYGNTFTKINLKVDVEKDKELEKMKDKLHTLNNLKEDMINDN